MINGGNLVEPESSINTLLMSSYPNQFVPEIISPLPRSSKLDRHTLLFVYFFKDLVSFTGSLAK